MILAFVNFVSSSHAQYIDLNNLLPLCAVLYLEYFFCLDFGRLCVFGIGEGYDIGLCLLNISPLNFVPWYACPFTNHSLFPRKAFDFFFGCFWASLKLLVCKKLCIEVSCYQEIFLVCLFFLFNEINFH